MTHIESHRRSPDAVGLSRVGDEAATFMRELYGQDFGLGAPSWDARQRNRRPGPASDLRARETGRLLAAFAAWLADAVVRWNTRNRQRRHLEHLPDHRLRDIGIRRDQIAGVAAGRVARARTPLEEAAAQVARGRLSGQAGAAGRASDTETPLAA